MPYPTPGDYQEAVQVPEAAFLDPALQDAEPEATVLGLPRALTGAFAVVFPLLHARTGARRYAARCFLTDVPDQRQRYAALAAHLAQREVPHLVGFDYQRQGIRAEGGVWPLLKMEWAEGVPLDAYLAAHHDEGARMDALGEAWRAMLEVLEDAEIAHGDLQHGNVLVQAGEGEEGGTPPRLVLVDYDAMIVPALASRGSTENGHRNYQHPDRDARTPGLMLDRFAGLAVYTALRALAEQPVLWERYASGENVLFRAADFYDPDASSLFADLRAIPAAAPLAAALASACYAAPERTPRVADVLAGETPVHGTRKHRRADPAAEAYARQQRRAARRTAAESAALLVLAVGLAAAAGALVLGEAAWGAGVLVAALVLFVGLAAILRARRPNARRHARLRAEVRYFDDFLDRLRAQSADLKAQREALGSGLEALEAERLAELREAALHDKLKHHFIGELEAVEGLNHRTVVRTKAAGLRTAVFVTPESVQKITEIGDAMRARILLWRSALEAEYASALPRELPPSEVQRLRRHRAHLRTDLTARLDRLREQIAVQERERADVAARLAGLPRLTLARYAGFLLRLRALPTAAPETVPRATPSTTPPPPAPPPDENAPWWQNAS